MVAVTPHGSRVLGSWKRGAAQVGLQARRTYGDSRLLGNGRMRLASVPPRLATWSGPAVRSLLKIVLRLPRRWPVARWEGPLPHGRTWATFIGLGAVVLDIAGTIGAVALLVLIWPWRWIMVEGHLLLLGRPRTLIHLVPYISITSPSCSRHRCHVSPL